MKEITSIHDKFFQETFTRKEIAASFLKHHLPESLSARLDFDTLTIVKDTFIDKELQEHFSDILYTVQLQDNPLYIYLLFEHKSRKERFVSLQILRYMVKIWDQYLKQNPKIKKLPAVFPMILYHGKRQWNISTNFQDIIQDRDDLMKSYIPRFCYQLYDVSHLPDAEIKGEVLGRIVLLIAKYIFSPDMKEKVFEIARLFQEVATQQTALEILEVLLRYVTLATGKFDEGDIRKIIRQTSIKEDIMQTFIDKYIQQGMQQGLQQGMQQGLQQGMQQGLQEGMQQGLQQGMQQGLQEGMKKIFLRQLQTRFGRVPKWAKEQIKQADMIHIENWSIRLLHAATLKDIFV